MRVLLDIQYSKADYVMDLLSKLTFVKAKTITEEKALLMEEIKEAVDNLNLVKKGKKKARPLAELLNEL
ncbi:MAG: hypothetical protein K9H64_15235 [Bacteroidales bacterium]|nr:hypothetical protein [Bacteroidales bacterium]MCF8457354.1 hypothetical protein [Bacteroidales bacterium]